MSYISLKTFQKYSNVFADEALQQSYINSAEEIVENYLGYILKLTEYITVITVNNSNFIQLRAKPITLISISINGQSQDLNDFYIEEEFVYIKRGLFNGEIEIVYQAGYLIIETPILDGDGNETGEYEIKTDIPEIILMTILRISSILQMESDGNIAITSRSFGEGGQRSFLNTTDYYRYLLPCSTYKLIRI